MAEYLQHRRGYYYLRFRVPKDLSAVFPEKEFIKSLHTKDKKSARLAATRLLAQTQEVFTLARYGYIAAEQVREKVCGLLERKVKAVPAGTPADASERPLLGEVIAQYTNDHKAGWTGKTALEYEGYYRLLLDALGERRIDSIDRDMVRDLRDTLVRLPANLYKRFPGLTIQQVLARDDISPMSTTTVNKLLRLLGSVMLHSVKEGYISSNPVEGLKVPQNRRADEERKAYTRDDLNRIVSALPTDKPERYWIPLIGMYSGMRLGEICSLRVADVREVDGVWCFDVNDDEGKRLKTASSKRLVPIHPELIGKGLLAFVNGMKEQREQRLWPDLQMRDTDGYCGAIGKWYQRFNRQYITDDPLKTFHSLRHTFADTLKQAGVQESLVAELMGHVNVSITIGRYGKKYQPKILYEAILALKILHYEICC